MTTKTENFFTEVFSSSKICYNFGAAYDIINPLIHTNCETMVCIDTKDSSIYKKSVDSHLPFVIDRFITQLCSLNKQRKKITSVFEDINLITQEDTKFEISLKYNNKIRTIIYYVGDGNEFIPPEIQISRENNTLDCIWWSMSDLKKSTIDYLQPKHLITFSTRLDEKPENYIFIRDTNTIRICPWSQKIKIYYNSVLNLFSLKI